MENNNYKSFWYTRWVLDSVLYVYSFQRSSVLKFFQYNCWAGSWYHCSIVPVLQLFRTISVYSANQAISDDTDHFFVFGPRISSKTNFVCVAFESWLHFSQRWLDFRFCFQCFVKICPYFNPHLLDRRLTGFYKISPAIVDS